MAECRQEFFVEVDHQTEVQDCANVTPAERRRAVAEAMRRAARRAAEECPDDCPAPRRVRSNHVVIGPCACRLTVTFSGWFVCEGDEGADEGTESGCGKEIFVEADGHAEVRDCGNVTPAERRRAVANAVRAAVSKATGQCPDACPVPRLARQNHVVVRPCTCRLSVTYSAWFVCEDI